MRSDRRWVMVRSRIRIRAGRSSRGFEWPPVRRRFEGEHVEGQEDERIESQRTRRVRFSLSRHLGVGSEGWRGSTVQGATAAAAADG